MPIALLMVVFADLQGFNINWTHLHVITSRHISFPIAYDAQRRQDIKSLVLYESADEGETWRQAAKVPPSAENIEATVDRDGIYCFVLQTLGKDHSKVPSKIDKNAVGFTRLWVDTQYGLSDGPHISLEMHVPLYIRIWTRQVQGGTVCLLEALGSMVSALARIGSVEHVPVSDLYLDL